MSTGYKVQANGGVQRLTDGAFIPPVPGNCDWNDYQAWLAAGNTPEPADPPPAPDPNQWRYQAYPDVQAHLEALYLARHGNPAPLAAIDAQIAAVRQRYPS
jgi:hypothetical protein